MTVEPIQADALWERYERDASRANRDALIILYHPLVEFVANRVASGFPASVEHGDLVNCGVFGLVDAIDKFDRTRGYKFETYAIARIRGAIFDELRQIDTAPRVLRTKARAHDAAVSRLESHLHRAPTSAEVADELGVETDVYREMVADIEQIQQHSLEDVVAEQPHQPWDGPAGVLHVRDVLHDRFDDPASSYDIEELRETLIAALRNMPRREQILLHLYYREDLSLPKVSVIFGVTPSRASQIHTQAVSLLWSKLVDA